MSPAMAADARAADRPDRVEPDGRSRRTDVIAQWHGITAMADRIDLMALMGAAMETLG